MELRVLNVHLQVKSVDLRDERTLVIRWTDGCEAFYPYSWLRDNCRCNSCYDHITAMRKVAFHNVNFDANVIDAQVGYVVQLLTWT